MKGRLRLLTVDQASARLHRALRVPDPSRQSGPVRCYDPQTGALLETIPFADFVERPARRRALARLWREPISQGKR